eukprot:COSAG06_NODE_47529_length_338_cov_1.284519_1_plen_101_part_10
MWTVLLDEPDTFECSSATGFVLYSLATGVQIGALGGDEMESAISRGWQALASSFVQPDGSVAVRNAFLVPILYPKRIILSRQARDEHMENSKKNIVCAGPV